MTTKEYLRQIVRLNTQIQNKLSEIRQLRSMTDSIGVSNDSERVQTSGDKDKIGVLMSRILDMESDLEKIIDKRCEIVHQIESIGDTDMYDVLANIYILGRDIKAIAIDRRMSYSHFKKEHAEALEEFERMYGELYLQK